MLQKRNSGSFNKCSELLVTVDTGRGLYCNLLWVLLGYLISYKRVSNVYAEVAVLSRAGKMDFKVREPWNTEKYCRAPWLADKKNFRILDAPEWLKQ